MSKYISRLLLIGDNKAQCREQLAPTGRHDAENDYPDKWQVPQRKSEGKGWADRSRPLPTTALPARGVSTAKVVRLRLAWWWHPGS
jgi:hypothetical protein